MVVRLVMQMESGVGVVLVGEGRGGGKARHL